MIVDSNRIVTRLQLKHLASGTENLDIEIIKKIATTQVKLEEDYKKLKSAIHYSDHEAINRINARIQLRQRQINTLYEGQDLDNVDILDGFTNCHYS